LLHQRAIDDPDSSLRAQALELLAGKGEWADAATRELLHQRAIDDPDGYPRVRALQLLAGKTEWAKHEKPFSLHDKIRELLQTTEAPQNRGWIICYHFGSLDDSDLLSEAKKWVFSRDIDGIAPYLDPFEPVSDEHLARVAQRANLSDEQRNQMVEEINTTLGWDIRQGREREDD
ncbi:MAG: hypothetical protein AAGG51_25645, partial [Cyanobacteria bacterium P01_G01_bin.54]